MILRVKNQLSYYVDRIVGMQPYSFARYGDGEWSSAMGKKTHPQKNCDGHFYFEEMWEDFQTVFTGLQKQPEVYDYILGMQNLALRMWGPQIERFLDRFGLQDRTWHDCDVFHHASRKGQLEPLVAALRDSSVVVVGPAHLRTLDRVFGYNKFVQVPRQNCYLHLDRITKQIEEAIAAAPKPVVVSLSASMPAEILIHRLYPKHGRHAFLIDFGSVFDPYAGVASRKYHQGMKLDAIRAISPTTRTTVAAGSAKGRRSR
jgi:hypothetical protein